uniref:6-Cys domain-containing protein n=1 Tax=Babesia bovis TaxID=5865 RepID=A0A0S3J427_BABBO|nr:hypothetical protein [Babesia bovis]
MWIPAIVVLLAIIGNQEFLIKRYHTGKGSVIKWVGNERQANWTINAKWDDKIHYYFDIDIYENENVEIRCPNNTSAEVELVPFKEGMCYNTDAFGNVGDGIKEVGVENLDRMKLKISNIASNIKFAENIKGRWMFMFDGEAYHYGMETIFFDCIVNTTVPLHVATIQLNIMPYYKNIPRSVHMYDFTKNNYSPPGKFVSYYKFPRPGSAFYVKCSRQGLSLEATVGLKQYSIKSGGCEDLSEAADDENVNLCLNFADETIVVLWPYNDIKVCIGDKNIFTFVRQDKDNTKHIHWTYMLEVFDSHIDSMDPAKDKIAEFYHAEDNYLIAPSKCPETVYDRSDIQINLTDFLTGAIFTRKSTGYVHIDISKYYTYTSHFVSCYKSTKRDIKQPNLTFKFYPVCDYENKDNLDMDGRTCSIFILNEDTVNVRGAAKYGTPLDLLPSNDSSNYLKDVTPPHSPWDSTILNLAHDEGYGIRFESIHDRHRDEIYVRFNYSGFAHTPKYFVWQKGPFDARNHHDKMMAVHLADEWVSTTESGTLDTESIDKVNADFPNSSKIIQVMRQNTRHVYIDCKSLFDESGYSEYLLYPQGKNTFFSKLGEGKTDPSELPSVQLQDEFAVVGISMYKKPEVNLGVDLEFSFEADSKIWAVHKKPIYFVCAKKGYKHGQNSHAYIAFDPLYQLGRLYGCGTRPELFLNEEGQRNSNTHCVFKIDDRKTVGFFCPSPIPDHFLSGDQTPWKSTSGAMQNEENPYHIMVKCFDRSTRMQRFLKPRNPIIDFLEPVSPGEVRSLWIFSRGQFVKHAKPIYTKVLCNCYNTEGKRVASIMLTPDFSVDKLKNST